MGKFVDRDHVVQQRVELDLHPIARQRREVIGHDLGPAQRHQRLPVQIHLAHRSRRYRAPALEVDLLGAPKRQRIGQIAKFVRFWKAIAHSDGRGLGRQAGVQDPGGAVGANARRDLKKPLMGR